MIFLNRKVVEKCLVQPYKIILVCNEQNDTKII